MMVTTFFVTSDIALIYRLETVALVSGLFLLAVGHLGWAREDETLEPGDASQSRKEGVTFSLVVGGILMATPMIIGLIAFRLFGADPNTFWKWFHDIGALTIGLAMLGSGILCRIRATTIAGFTTLLAYLVTLVVLVPWPSQLQSVSVMLMIGGGAFFGIGILLSLYRDRLLNLPGKLKAGEGVFQVLKWR